MEKNFLIGLVLLLAIPSVLAFGFSAVLGPVLPGDVSGDNLVGSTPSSGSLDSNAALPGPEPIYLDLGEGESSNGITCVAIQFGTAFLNIDGKPIGMKEGDIFFYTEVGKIVEVQDIYPDWPAPSNRVKIKLTQFS